MTNAENLRKNLRVLLPELEKALDCLEGIAAVIEEELVRWHGVSAKTAAKWVSRYRCAAHARAIQICTVESNRKTLSLSVRYRIFSLP